MDNRTVAQLNHEGFFLYAASAYGDGMPGGAREEFPPDALLPEHHRWRWTGKKYEATPDYRGTLVYRQDGTTYHPETWGPLPDGDSITPPPPAPPTLEEEKARAVAALREKRKAVEYGGVEIGGVMWDSAEKDELRLNSVMKLFESGTLTSYDGWKVGEGVYITLTPAILQQATMAFMEHYGKCFAVEAAKLAQIDALESTEAVDAWLATELNQGW